MHTIPELGTSVPAFLAKLWKLVEDPETDDLICWSPNGRSFFIRNQAQFARELLPHYYKHNNMASFVRQLNMYGFHKKVSVELGGLKCDRDEMEFAHQFFCKGHPYLVEHIKRKIASSKGQDPALAPMKPELMNKMLTEVRSMRGRQEHLDSRLGAMKRENEALWRELAMLRQKHLKQQQIVNKLIHFLVTLVQPSRSGGLSVKRRYPLMIDDSTRQRSSKQSKLSKPEASPTGPVIHELDASEPDLDSEYIVAEMLDNSNPSIESPDHREGDIGEDNMESIQLIDDSVQFRNDVHLVNLQEIDMKKTRGCRGKKKRKNKVPVKILIPSTVDGEEPREETHLLEVPLDDTSVPITLIEQPKIVPVSKPVPLATVRSSKLAAMAANMKKTAEAETELELESSMDADEDAQDADSTLVKLQDILIVPEIINEENVDENCDFVGSDGSSMNGNEVNILTAVIAENGINDEMAVPEKADSPTNQKNKAERYNQPDNADGNHQKEMTQGMSKPHGEQMINQPTNKGKSNGAGSSSTKDLSVTCVNPSGASDAVHRLGPMEEVDTHLETMQTDLDNLRELLRGEGYSIDANTLLGLFGAEDPMSFGVPVNPELNPHAQCDKEIEDLDTNGLDGFTAGESMNGSGNGGELMAYNPAPSLLDFDDDIFLAASSSPVTTGTGDAAGNNFYTGDSLDLEDSKASILESLVANDVNNTS